MAFINPALDIAVISAILAIGSRAIQEKLGIRKKQKSSQKRLKEKQARAKELMKKTDDKNALKELEAVQKEMMEISLESMQAMNKYLLFYMPITLVVFIFVLPPLYDKAIINLPVPVPWFGANWSIIFYEQTNWIGWYFLLSIIFGVAINLAFTAFEHFRGEKNAEKK